jgi:predicted transcriptional regulator
MKIRCDLNATAMYRSGVRCHEWGLASVATPERIIDHNGLSSEQINLIQQFEADFNAVDHFLRVALDREEHVGFTKVVGKYAERHPGWRDAELLRRIAKIRNLIVHDKIEPFNYPVIPTPAVNEELRKCKEKLINPDRALLTFKRAVHVISIHNTLTQVLRIIDHRDYSQFPVYEDKQFRGLLTENGVTRWLARHVVRNLSLVELDEIFVSHVLQSEEVRKNHQFVPGDMPVDEVSELFAKQAMLEAVLVTATGKQTEDLLGVATRWDILQLA